MFSRSVAAIRGLLPEQPSSPQIVLIDGPSGAGKSTLAAELVLSWPCRVTLIRLDDLYPGWGGLDTASTQIGEIVQAFRRRSRTQWRRWDWSRNAPAELVSVPLDADLIVEGCGAVSRVSASGASLAVWVTADDDVRKPRALARDRGRFDAYWNMWDQQFEAFVERESPQALCDLTIDTSRSATSATSHQ